MSGTAWLVEALSMKENDKRRHRSNCVYYDKADSYCHFYCEKCFGSAHCYKYTEKDIKQTQENIKSKISITPFHGVKEIPLELINVDKQKLNFVNSKEIDSLVQKIKENGKLKKAMHISYRNNKYYLEDTYAKYCAYKRLNIKSVPAKIVANKDNINEYRVKKAGTRVFHKRWKMEQ